MILNTVVSRSSSSLFQHLLKVKPDPNAVILFSVSANASNLEAIISRMRLLARHSIGCLSSPFPGASETVVCSTATFSLQDCIPFRSDIRGRAPVQVGRWKREAVTVDEKLPDFTKSSPTWKGFEALDGDSQLPEGLHGRSLKDINSLLFFSDNAPEGLMRSLSQISHAEKLGLVASSTPFVTGRPFTLFHDERIYSSGAVGLGLKYAVRPTARTFFHGLVPLSAPMKVSKSEGNLIHELDHSNPSKILVEAITSQDRSTNKDDNLFLGHLSSEPFFNQGGPRTTRIYRILSGDPSRGSIALEADIAPEKGEVVKFFRQAPRSPSAVLRPITLHMEDEPSLPSLQFLCSTDYSSMTSMDEYLSEGEKVRAFRNSFLATSENGFLCTAGDSSSSLWKCAVPGAVGSFAWADNKLA